MPKRPRHSCKEVEAVLKRLVKAGWQVVHPSGHWGRAECGDGCTVAVPGTPRDCTFAARHVIRAARKCPHGHAPS